MDKSPPQRKRKKIKKKTNRTRNRSSRQTRSKRKKVSKWGKAWIFHLLVILFLILTAWILWLDHTVQEKFEGYSWALPARVYARPLELYPSKKLELSDLLKELDILGYRRVLSPKNHGEFSANANTVNVYTRGFNFNDGLDNAKKLSLSFSQGRLQSIYNLPAGERVSVARIEPVEIAKIYPQHHEDRVIVRLDEVPPFLVKALLATEDRRFYEHYGIDPKGIARAIVTNIKAMRLKQGASTLTQQLIKNIFLSNERTFWRKINEQVMALLLEYRYEKNVILEAYLNEVFLGQDNRRAIHGFGLAAEYYFSAPLSELRREQLALLVGMVKGPSYYEPRRHPERALKRRNVVLNSLAGLGEIDATANQSAQAADLGLSPRRSLSRSRYPAFTELVRKQLVQNYAESDLRNAGLRIFTTLDPIVQDKTELVVSQRLKSLESQKQLQIGKLEAAVIVTDISSGEISAVVGSRNKHALGINRAISSSRHIGSLIKPVVYLTGLENKFSLASLLRDEPIVWTTKNQKDWRPENYDKIFHGDVPLITALGKSYNAATVWLGKYIGLEKVVDRLNELGLKKTIPAFPSLLLGAVELSPLEVSRFYQTLANDGFSITPRTIRAVLTQDNQPLQRYELEIGRAIEPAEAYLIKYAMTEVVRQGTAKSAASALSSNLPLAGKTGTTGGLKDSWYAGFDKNTLSVIWIGRDDKQSSHLTGTSGALRVWIDLMKKLPTTPINLTAPENIEWHWIDQQTGKLTAQECPGSNVLPFKKGTEPKEYSACGKGNHEENKPWSESLFEGWLN